jgi:hypothetical protein
LLHSKFFNEIIWMKVKRVIHCKYLNFVDFMNRKCLNIFVFRQFVTGIISKFEYVLIYSWIMLITQIILPFVKLLFILKIWLMNYLFEFHLKEFLRLGHQVLTWKFSLVLKILLDFSFEFGTIFLILHFSVLNSKLEKSIKIWWSTQGYLT